MTWILSIALCVYVARAGWKSRLRSLCLGTLFGQFALIYLVSRKPLHTDVVREADVVHAEKRAREILFAAIVMSWFVSIMIVFIMNVAPCTL